MKLFDLTTDFFLLPVEYLECLENIYPTILTAGTEQLNMDASQVLGQCTESQDWGVQETGTGTSPTLSSYLRQGLTETITDRFSFLLPSPSTGF